MCVRAKSALPTLARAADTCEPRVFVRRGTKRRREAVPEARARTSSPANGPVKKQSRWTQPAPPGRRTGRRNAGQGRGWRDSWWKA